MDGNNFAYVSNVNKLWWFVKQPPEFEIFLQGWKMNKYSGPVMAINNTH